MTFSVVILTYRREQLVLELIGQLREVSGIDQIVLVDNECSNNLKQSCICFEDVCYVDGDNERGTSSRNLGIDIAVGDIVVCMDDDVFGLDNEHISKLKALFKKEKDVGAVCFKVVNPDGAITNWCHHCRSEEFSEKEFETFEISEGAVAFRRNVLEKVGLFPEGFFISHEGLDLSLRIIDAGYRVKYSFEVKLIHRHSRSGRKSWRRYYFDTRNLFYIWKRNYPFLYGIRYVLRGLAPMFFYSLRDGFIKYHIKGIFDGLNYLLSEGERSSVTTHTLNYIKSCKKNKPGFMYLAKKRVFRRGVEI